MIVTIQRWKYNNDFMRIDKNSELEVHDIKGGTAAECMDFINGLRGWNDMTKYTNIEIINVQD